MKRALLLTDYIHGFADEGSLSPGLDAQAIRENIARAISRLDKGDLLVLANDSQILSAPHAEKMLFPPHALTGARGAQNVLEEEAVAAACETITIRRTRYSSFFGTGLRDILKTAGTGKLYLAGAGTDTCVLHTAIDAYNFGFDTAVLADCVAACNPAGHEFALSHFKNTLGFELVSSYDI